ncbi:ADP-ribosylglycohydrolase family protein [Hydrogenophaga aromaticivorans]|uniref:ADP-ribosylglycohydrolase family protein n=1 Tax=Hydrogenophaga aromaticivorans TaxID=2610898 RepID=UPI001B38BBF3|nr:ADP-ribosylglycohydrolase family protein [Hydrogenophaga aromaticivorans]MBQ0917748.1 ADP-ribosylglycohydrolase family protein [Hydrogenophaga aromaticivorans]
MTNIIHLAQGCLLGALVGDAAGARLEFLGRKPTEVELADALAMKGGGVLRVAPGQVTDDGELTLALARALVDSPQFPREEVAASYRAWVDSSPFDMGQATSAALGGPAHSTGSLADAISRRAAAHNMASKANGALMRASALGIWSTGLSMNDAAQAARDDASLTHPNPSCQWASAAYVVAIRHLLLNSGDGSGAFEQAKEALGTADEESEEVLSWLEDAESGELPAAYPSAGFVRIAFCHAFHHLLRGHIYVQAVHQVLACGGDSDTNACIVGGLVGARVGISGIPENMTRAVLECDTTKGRPRPEWLSTRDALGIAQSLLG